jgi:vacuolar-type H+-ATPase subunit I/STV1
MCCGRIVGSHEFMDYAYFTILSSNCFGPPEGHLLVGRPIKVLHSVHSLAMITVFIVILARAINTLN